MHYIRYDVLYQAVLERLQYWAKAVQQDEEKVLNKIQKAGNAERIREKKKKASALKKAENRQNEIDRLFAKMYEDRACEKITERNFIMLSGKYQKEQIELEQQITNLREELSKMEQDMIGAEKWIELIKEYSVPKELTAPLLNAMQLVTTCGVGHCLLLPPSLNPFISPFAEPSPLVNLPLPKATLFLIVTTPVEPVAGFAYKSQPSSLLQ